ncbi:M48 family metallopeptidase [Altererythrobacter sp. Root672]|uniref:M48 family metallopeptidase n=1 Tax=Altererythrobacter sp. Root672 TaxID=1736584 RepID=UPI00138EE15F|nr:M48 family metallopeptidase [Altererythrobacter sp. Root672]
MRKLLIAAAALACGSQAVAQEGGSLDALLQQDVRLATIAERLMGANHELCRQQMPLTGLIMHSRDQYPKGGQDSAFVNGAIAVSALVPGSPAAAVLEPRDGLAVIGAVPTSGLKAEGKSPVRDAAFEALADQPPQGPMQLKIVRQGQEQAVSLGARPGCRVLVEIRVADGLNGQSDGRVIQVNYGLATVATNDELAVVFAHELAHVVLEHRRRLKAAGVDKGFFGEFGRNQQLNRQVEVEADRMAVHLLANAGYDPSIAPKFWRSSLGQRTSGGLTRSRVYPSPEARAELIEREIADYLGGGTGPSYPGHLLVRRDQPFEN